MKFDHTTDKMSISPSVIFSNGNEILSVFIFEQISSPGGKSTFYKNIGISVSDIRYLYIFYVCPSELK